MFITYSPDRQVESLANADPDRRTTDHVRQREVVLQMLNSLLSSELVGVVRHQRHHDMARDLDALYTGHELLDRAADNQRHVDLLIQRISELGGVPELSPSALLDCHHTQLIEDTTLCSLLSEDLIAQCDQINDYRSLIKYLGEQDPATRRVLALILALEQQHKGEFARKILAQCEPD